MDSFEVIVVGAGLAGLAAAYTLADAGAEVVVLERGDYPGAKNVSGGRLYLNPVRDLFPTLLEEKVPMFLCGACAKTYNISEDDLVESVKIAHIPTIAAEMADRETITF